MQVLSTRPRMVVLRQQVHLPSGQIIPDYYQLWFAGYVII